MGIDQTQTESWDSIHAKAGTHLQVKVCEWRKNDTLDDYVSVGKHAVGKCVTDADNEKCDRQLECAHLLRSTGCQDQRRGGDGSMVEKTSSSCGHAALKSRDQSL